MKAIKPAPLSLLGAILCIALGTTSTPTPAVASTTDEQLHRAALLLNSGAQEQRAQADPLLRTLADAGQAQAAALLAYAMHYGLIASSDEDQPLSWWRRAAQLGDRDAAFNLGLVLLRNGDQPAALQWLQQAAEAGDRVAAFVLGTSLAERAEAADLPAARRWLEAAAAGGYPPAQYNLATLLMSSTAEADHAAARQWLQAAATTFQPARETLLSLAGSVPKPSERPSATVAGRGAIHDIEWLQKQASGDYTIQIATGHSEDAIIRLLKRNPSFDDAAWFLHRPRSSEPYSAIVGVYHSFDEAERALGQLPEALRNNAPWIRRFGVLQHELQHDDQGQPASPPTARPPGP